MLKAQQEPHWPCAESWNNQLSFERYHSLEKQFEKIYLFRLFVCYFHCRRKFRFYEDVTISGKWFQNWGTCSIPTTFDHCHVTTSVTLVLWFVLNWKKNKADFWFTSYHYQNWFVSSMYYFSLQSYDFNSTTEYIFLLICNRI